MLLHADGRGYDLNIVTVRHGLCSPSPARRVLVIRLFACEQQRLQRTCGATDGRCYATRAIRLSAALGSDSPAAAFYVPAAALPGGVTAGVRGYFPSGAARQQLLPQLCNAYAGSGVDADAGSLRRFVPSVTRGSWFLPTPSLGSCASSLPGASATAVLLALKTKQRLWVLISAPDPKNGSGSRTTFFWAGCKTVTTAYGYLLLRV